MSVLSGKMDQLAIIATSVLTKKAAVDAATLAGGGDPAAMGMDPAMAGGGGGMGMDPAAMAPAGGGGDPMAGAPPEPDPMEQRLAALEAQLAAGGGGGGGAGGMEPIKPKIDVNVEMMQIKKMLAKVVDALGIQMPAAEMVATEEDLTSMGMPGGDPAAAGGAGAGSAIAPIDPMQGASQELAGGGGKIASDGEAYDGSGLADLADRADALFEMMSGQ